MDALLMCGGRGTRLDAPVEKPLFEVGGRPMVDRVREALAAARVDAVYAVVSPHVSETRAHLDLPVVGTPGEGYVEDLGVALDDGRIERPVLTAVADLPLLAPEHVNAAIDRHDGKSVAVCVPAALKRLMGLTAEETAGHGGPDLAPAGLNVVDGADEAVTTSYDARLAVNVNRLGDARIAEELL